MFASARSLCTRISALAALAFTFLSPLATAGAQTPGQWVWMGGSSTLPASCGAATPDAACARTGVYGTQGQFDDANHPGGRQGAATWTDAKGHLWLFGGFGLDDSGNKGALNDLWQFDPALGAHGRWAWISGLSTITGSGLPGVFGNLGVFSDSNAPGGRQGAAAWIDANGKLWLFGGYGPALLGASVYQGEINDLWQFDPALGAHGQWAWMGGTKNLSPSGVYGTQGQFQDANLPGGRQNAAAWADLDGHLWLFGGWGNDSGGNLVNLNDLWEFKPALGTHGQWAWMGGASSVPSGNGKPGVYGTKGKFDAANQPGGRYSQTDWTDAKGRLWMMGGMGLGTGSLTVKLNDLWVFDPLQGTYGEWAWMGGAQTGGQPGVYGVKASYADAAQPGARFNATAWVDPTGVAWLFSGFGVDSASVTGNLNDLWSFDATKGASGQWAWQGGLTALASCTGNGSYCGVNGVYGTLGSSAAANLPGSRQAAAAWKDASGNLWLFGGWGFDSAGNEGYLDDLWEFVLPKALTAQTIDFPQPVSPVVYGAKPITLAATATSKLAVVFSVLSGPGKVSGTNGTTLTFTGAGTIVVATNQPGDATFAAAPQLTRSIVVGKAAQTLAFPQPASPLVFGAKPIALTATSTSGLPVAFSVLSGPGKASGTNGATLAFTGVGTLVLAANQAGNANFTAAAQVTRSIVIGKAAQTLAFPKPATPLVYGVKPITLKATASSGLAVAFSVLSGPGKASGANGATLTVTGVGTLVVAANQAGNANFTAAPQLKYSIVVSKAPLTVAATSLAMKQGAKVPALTYAITGYVNSETAAKVLTGKPALTTAVTSKSAVGAYAITTAAGTLKATNYAFIFKSGTLTVTGQVATPTLSLKAGKYKGAQKLTLADITPGATIYYTTDGSAPSATHGTKYTATISVAKSETVKAVAVLAGCTASAQASAAYTIQ
jgi:hypothetical protein